MNVFWTLRSGSSGGGGSLIGPRYGDVSLFRGTFLLKVVELWVSASEPRTELWVTFQEAYRIMGPFWKSGTQLPDRKLVQDEYPNRNVSSCD